MAITWIEGFDLYNSTASLSQRYAVVPGFPAYVTGRFSGGRAIKGCQGLQGYLWGGSTTANLAVGMAFQVDDITLCGTFLQFRNGLGTDIVDLRVLTTGAIQATRNGSVLGTSAVGLISNNVWHYVECEIVRNASTGVFNVYLDGTSILSLSGQNTGASDIDTLRFTTTNTALYIDDLYATNVATKLGESRVDTLRPSADSSVQWTPNSGANNWSRVSEAQWDDDTTYVSDATVGHKDLYDCVDLSFTPNTVRAVQVNMHCRKDDATVRQIRANLKSGATTNNGTTRTMATTYQTFVQIYEQDPNTTAAWTASAVNAAQIGPEVVT